jgi:hypothetical protein
MLSQFRGIDRNAVFLCPYSQNSRRSAGDIGQIDPVRRSVELFGFNHFQIGQIFDQCQQVLTRSGDISGILAVFLRQRPSHPGSDRFGIGDDPGNRLTQHRRNIAADQSRPVVGQYNGPRLQPRRRWQQRCVSGQEQVKPARVATRHEARQQARPPTAL